MQKLEKSADKLIMPDNKLVLDVLFYVPEYGNDLQHDFFFFVVKVGNVKIILMFQAEKIIGRNVKNSCVFYKNFIRGAAGAGFVTRYCAYAKPHNFGKLFLRKSSVKS